MANLIDDPILTLEHPRQERSEQTLAGTLAALLSERGPPVEGFPNLSAPQHSYWYRFLVRCAARALEVEGRTVQSVADEPPDSLAETVRDALQRAAGGGAAWSLHAGRAMDPAFLQAPATADQPLDQLKFKRDGVSRLTGAMGAKNHERKPGVIRWLSPERLVFALVEYQTSVIYAGRGNYESQLTGSRSGAASGTPFMGAWLDGSLERTFRYDVQVLLKRLDTIRSDHGLRGDLWALWTEPWNGKDPVPSHALHPAFIPLARQVRLEEPVEGGYRGLWFRASKGPRVDDAAGGGDFGDPFTPTIDHASGRKVRGTIGRGYDYREMISLLLGDEGKHPSRSVAELRKQRFDPDVRVEVRFEGTSFQQGKTVGFHSRMLPAPAVGYGRTGYRPVLDDPERALEVHRAMLDDVKAAQSVLRGAARLLVHGSVTPRDGDSSGAIPTELLNDWLEERYYPLLNEWAARYAEGEEWQAEWRRSLAGAARDAFRAAEPRLSVTTGSRFERQSGAWSYLGGMLNRRLDLSVTHASEVQS